MTQEQKKLLLKDLCGRLPYGVKCEVTKRRIDGEMVYIRNGSGALELTINNVKELVTNNLYEIKPYLFPLSSMTEEEKKEYRKACELDTEILSKCPMDGAPFPALYNSQDWLNAHNFDYRGLIPKGLANDATSKNIY